MNNIGLANYKACAHKELKFFPETNKVVCLECGKSWDEQPFMPEPVLPMNPPTPQPDYPVYPIVTWVKIEE